MSSSDLLLALTDAEQRDLNALVAVNEGSNRSERETKATVPHGFRLSKSGLFLIGDDAKPDLWICDRLEVVSMTRDSGGESWGRLLQWRDADRRLHSWSMPLSILAGSLQQERMLATVSGLFGGLIVLLTGVGLYAFCNYLLTLRTKELAIRASLGAGPAQIAAALLQETAKALALGSIIGIAMTFAGQRILSGVMEKVNPLSAGQIIAALLIITTVTFGAVLLPIIRALRISIIDALRVE
jgi:ABC-type antimicrobial peptide transport system permease subunit